MRQQENTAQLTDNNVTEKKTTTILKNYKTKMKQSMNIVY